MTQNINDFDYHLPEGRVALYPAEPRDSSRLLHLPLSGGPFGHYTFAEFPNFLRKGDLLVLNDSRVFPARLHGTKKGSGGKVELFLLQELDGGVWEALVRPGRRLPPGTEVDLFEGRLHARLGERTESGGRRVSFESQNGELMPLIWQYGEIPLPPYIARDPDEDDKTRYQTVYAEHVGAVAAPTAGFHFTVAIFEHLNAIGIEIAMVTLHPGLGTFRPITTSDISEHKMHEEKFFVPESTARAVNRARSEGRRVIAVGTTSVRSLESACDELGMVSSHGWQKTKLFIKPSYKFKCVDGLLTNFHLPKSTLLLLVSALAGRERILAAYQEAIEKGYRFYSYGDAMLIL